MAKLGLAFSITTFTGVDLSQVDVEVIGKGEDVIEKVHHLLGKASLVWIFLPLSFTANSLQQGDLRSNFA